MRAKKGPGTASPNHRSGPVTLAGNTYILTRDERLAREKHEKKEKENMRTH
jgi:hypothetical protein